MATGAALVLVITAARGAHPIRLPLVKRITSVGSDATADVCLATAPAHWAVVHRGDDAAEVVLAGSGERRRLAPGDKLEAEGIGLALESSAQARDREQAIDALVSALAAVDTPERAVEGMLAGLIGASERTWAR